MTATETLINALFGNPASDSFKPSREGVANAFRQLETAIAFAAAGYKTFNTLNELNAFTPGQTDPKIAFVITGADAGAYAFTGAIPWVKYDGFNNGLVSVVQPRVDIVIAAINEFRNASPRLVQNIATLGNVINRAKIALQVTSGATAIDNGISFTNGGGNGSFIVFDAAVDDVCKSLIPDGALVRSRAVISVSANSSPVGLPSASFATRIIYNDGTAENNDFGDVDTDRTAYIDNTLISETTFIWSSNIKSVGRLIQFGNVQGFAGTREFRLVACELIIDKVPFSYGFSSNDLVRQIEAERTWRGYAIQFTVKGNNSDFGALSLAQVALKNANGQNRQQLLLLGFDNTKIALPNFTDISSNGGGKISYNGSVTMTDATRTNYDPITLTGNHRLIGLVGETINSNYFHSESANQVKDWVQEIYDCKLRHNGNEQAFANGGLSEGGRHIPPLGVGMSSGSKMIVKRCELTSFKGGGGYWHNAANQTKPCEVIISDVVFGCDSLISPDIQVSTLGSGTLDSMELNGCILGNGVISYDISSIPSDPMMNFASHADIRIFGKNLNPHTFIINDPGMALRVRSVSPNGPAVILSGETVDVLFTAGNNLGLRINGDTDTKAGFIGALDIAGHSIGRRVMLVSGQRRLTVSVGGQSATYTFNGDTSAVSNNNLINAMNAAFAGIAVVDIVPTGKQYRPEIYDQENRPINVGSVPIFQGTLVLVSPSNNTCRSLEPQDMTNGTLSDKFSRVGVSLQYIARNTSGRVQTRGHVNWEHLIGWEAINGQIALATGRNNGLIVGEGLTVQTNDDGVHGTVKYSPQSTILQCVQNEINDGLGRYIPRKLFVGE